MLQEEVRDEPVRVTNVTFNTIMPVYPQLPYQNGKEGKNYSGEYLYHNRSYLPWLAICRGFFFSAGDKREEDR